MGLFPKKWEPPHRHEPNSNGCLCKRQPNMTFGQEFRVFVLVAQLLPHPLAPSPLGFAIMGVDVIFLFFSA